jgi:hypothetical protein
VWALAGAWATTVSIAAASDGRADTRWAEEVPGHIEQTAERVRQALNAARQSRDVVKTLCLNDKLSQLERTVRSAQESRQRFRGASVHGDAGDLAHTATILQVLAKRADQLAAEADGCVGEEYAWMARTQVAVSAPAGGTSTIEEDLATAGGWGPADMGTAAPARSDAPRASSLAVGSAPGPRAPPPSVPLARTAPSPAWLDASRAAHDPAMVAYSADLTMAVFEVERGLGSVEAIASSLGGYLAKRNDAQVVVRVPRAQFGDALRRVMALGDVLHRNVAAEDVTDEFVDLELRLKNARALRDQFVELLRKASVKDAVEIQQQLAHITEIIEQIEGRLQVLRDRVDFSTIAVTFQASTSSPVRSTALLPFSFLDAMGLAPLLNVPRVPQ